MPKYLWHLKTSPWERIMEKLEDVPKTFKTIHEKFLSKRGHKGTGKNPKKSV